MSLADYMGPHTSLQRYMAPFPSIAPPWLGFALARLRHERPLRRVTDGR